MRLKLNQLAAATAAALGVAISGAAFDVHAAGDKAKQAGTSATPAASSASSSTAASGADARLSAITGQTVKDASGTDLGTIQSYTSANGQVTATVRTPSGSTQEVPLGPTETVASQVSASGSFALTAPQSGAASAAATT